jgi:membrane protein YqaA with SNARE-associated domain
MSRQLQPHVFSSVVFISTFCILIRYLYFMCKKNSRLKDLWTMLKGCHLSNKKKGLYAYMGWSALKIVAIYAIIIVAVVLTARNLIDFNLIYQNIFQNHSKEFIIGIFFISESFLGMIPPDLFVIWSSKFNAPLLLLILLGFLSYMGGAVSYLIGYWFSNRPVIKSYTERVLYRYILFFRKWGGAFIIIAALFPFSPFSLVIMAVSLLRYPFKYYLLFGIARIARFLIQGIFYLNIFNIDTFFY